LIAGRARRAAALLVLGCAVALGSGNLAVGAQEPPSACELFSRSEAKKITGKPVRRETSITGQQGSECSYSAQRDAKRVVGVAVGEFATDEEASKAYTRARANAQFDGLTVENVRRLGQRAYWLHETTNFERTVRDEKLVIGEVTVLDGRRVYTAYLAPPSKKKARDAINLMIAD
jgi:hypothetical protein